MKPEIRIRKYAGAVYDKAEIMSMISAILDGWWSGGQRTSEFEKAFAEFLGVKHAVACNSGSSANLLAITSLELRKGSEVITPATTFPTTVNPVIQCGLIPVFVDVELNTLNINPGLIERAITDKTRLVLIPHTLGNPCHLEEIKRICSQHGLRLIEDSCDALGSRYGGRYVSTFGDAGTFSFYPAHHITTGEGGMVVTDDDDFAERARGYRDWGRACNCDPCVEMIAGKAGLLCRKRLNFRMPDGSLHDRKYVYRYIGYNLKITELQAAMGMAQLGKLDGFIRSRKDNFARLKSLLEECRYFMLPQSYEGAEACWFAFPLIISDEAPFTRSQATRFLEREGVQTRPIFAGNILRHPAYAKVKSRVVGSLNASDKVMRDAFFVGVYPGLTPEDIDFIGGCIRDIDNGRARLPGQQPGSRVSEARP